MGHYHPTSDKRRYVNFCGSDSASGVTAFQRTTAMSVIVPVDMTCGVGAGNGGVDTQQVYGPSTRNPGNGWLML